jgi:nucleoside phosphorylase
VKAALPLAGRIGSATFAVLVITESEFAAAQTVFNARRGLVGTAYFVRAKNKSHSYDFVLRRAGDRSNVASALATASLIEDFRPAYVLLVGTCGGVGSRDGISFGDVLVADFVDYTEFQKIKDSVNLARKIAFDHPSFRLREIYAEQLRAGDDSWRDYLKSARRPRSKKKGSRGPNRSRVYFGNLAATEKILSSTKDSHQLMLMKRFDTALVFETESYGVARKIYEARGAVNYNPQYLTIRGVSDLIDEGQSDKARKVWTDYAAHAACAFARRLIELTLTGER